MGQILRVTFEQKDYTFKLLNTLPIGKETKYLDILFEDVTYHLIKDNENWIFENIEDLHLIKLSIAIGKSISLRYRI